MHKEFFPLHSLVLGRDLGVLVYGHAGAPLIAFPTSLGPYWQWEEFGMVAALSEQLERGSNQLFCVESLDALSFYADGRYGRPLRPPRERIAVAAAYQRALAEELLPAVRAHNPDGFVMTAGCSFGAYHAVNFAFRNPGAVRRVIGMSGVYDIRAWLGGFYDDDVYFNNPVDYMRNLSDAGWLARFRHELDIILAAGTASSEADNNRQLSQILWDKGIWHAMRWWDGWAHDWPWWRQQIVQYVNGA